MSKHLKSMGSSLAAAGLAGIQLAILVSVVASQLGERALRGAQGFALYRATLTAEQG